MSTLQIGLNGQIITLVSAPTATERAAVQFDMADAVSLVTSEFTGQSQAQKWPGADMLSGTMTWPPLKLVQANDVLSFLRQCRGMANAFLLSDPLHWAPMGAGGGTPFVDNTQNGGNPAGSEWLGTKGWPANTLVLKRGDAFCTDWRLYYANDDVISDGAGNALINIWPTVREQPSQDGTSNGWQNATGTVTLTAGQPLGNPAYYAMWSNFGLIPGVELPNDAVIQGIYPVMVATNNSNAVPDQRFGVGLKPWSGGAGTQFTTPTVPYANAEFYWAVSIGTSLTALNGQQMFIQLGATLANPFTGSFSASAVGYAIYYTSATPFTDPSIAPPFAVPGGQGLAWAMPFTSTYGLIEPGHTTNGSAVSTPAILNGQIGLNKPTGLFRLASNKRTWSADPSLITHTSFPVQEYR